MKIWEFENKPRNYFVVLIFFLPALLIDLKYLAVGKCIELFKNVFEPYPLTVYLVARSLLEPGYLVVDLIKLNNVNKGGKFLKKLWCCVSRRVRAIRRTEARDFSFETLYANYGGQFTLSTQFITLNYPK